MNDIDIENQIISAEIKALKRGKSSYLPIALYPSKVNRWADTIITTMVACDMKVEKIQMHDRKYNFDYIVIRRIK
jgi:hypothetical protein